MMQQQDPFEAAGFVPVGNSSTGGLTAVPLPKPVEPRVTYSPLSPAEIKQRGLNPGHAYQMSSDGKIDDLGATNTATAGGVDAAGSANVRKDAIQAYTDAAGLEAIADNLQKQFDAGPGATKGLAGIWDLLPTAGNKTFNDTADQARGFVKRALGYTGGEGNTIGEIQLNYGPYLPEASDWDGRIVNKIEALRGLAAQSRKRAVSVLGGVPDANGNIMPQSEEAPAVQPIAGGEDTLPVPTLAASTNGMRSVIDEKKRALGGKIVGLVSKGADRNTIMGFAVRNDPTLRDDPKFKAWVDEALKYRKANPGAKFPVDPSFYTTDVAMTPDEISANEKGQSSLGAAGIAAADALTAGNLGRLGAMVGGDQATIDQNVSLSARDNPNAAFAGSVAGGTLAALTGEAALARLGMAPGALRALMADGGYGGTVGATNAEEGEGAMGALKGAATGALGGFVGGQGANVLGKIARGVSDPTVGYVAKELPGRLTVGQMVGQSGAAGRMVKGAEDRLSGIPVVGDMVNARRLEGLTAMNVKAFDRALEPIKANVSGKFGEEAVAEAQQKVSDAFTSALAGKSAMIDTAFITSGASAKRAIDALPDRVAGEVGSSVDEIVRNYVDPATLMVSGENMQAMLRELDMVKRAYKNDPLGHRIGKAVDQVTDSVEGLFQRQAPDVMPQYKAAKKAFQRLSTVEDAVLRAKQTGGVFTPAQLGMADRAGTVKFGGKHKAAAGGGEFHDFQRAMQDVLPNKVPDSGTAGRLIVPVGLATGGAGVGAAAGDAQSGGQAGLTLGALLSLAYSRKGQGLLRAVTRPSGPKGQAVGRAIDKSKRAIGAAAGSQAALTSR